MAGSLGFRQHVITVPTCENGHHKEHRVKVLIGGQGAFPVVWVHGFFLESEPYRLPISQLAQDFRVIAIDLAGHGETQSVALSKNAFAVYADIIRCTLQELGIRRALLVGHSMGAPIIVNVALEDPEMVVGLVPINGIIGQPWDDRMRQVRRRVYPVIPIVGRLVADMARTIWRAGRAGDLSLAYTTARTCLWSVLHLWRLALPGLAILRAAPSAPMLRSVARQQIPTIVVCSSHDRVVTPRDGQSAASLAGGYLEEVPGGHCWPLENRRVLASAIEGLRQGRLGELLKSEFVAHGLDPSAVPAEVQTVYYRPDALALSL